MKFCLEHVTTGQEYGMSVRHAHSYMYPTSVCVCNYTINWIKRLPWFFLDTGDLVQLKKHCKHLQSTLGYKTKMLRVFIYLVMSMCCLYRVLQYITYIWKCAKDETLGVALRNCKVHGMFRVLHIYPNLDSSTLHINKSKQQRWDRKLLCCQMKCFQNC